MVCVCEREKDEGSVFISVFKFGLEFFFFLLKRKKGCGIR